MPLHSHSPSHSLTHRPTITPLSVTLSTLTQTSCHPLYSLTHPFHSHSFSTILHSSALPKDLIHSEVYRDCIKRSSQSFEFLQSMRSLEKKKKVSPFMQNAKTQFSPFGCWETMGKIKETLVSILFLFFLFWFLYWISNRTVKKDRSFIVFWDWIGMWNRIMFLGLFIFAEDLIYCFVDQNLLWFKFDLVSYGKYVTKWWSVDSSVVVCASRWSCSSIYVTLKMVR